MVVIEEESAGQAKNKRLSNEADNSGAPFLIIKKYLSETFCGVDVLEIS